MNWSIPVAIMIFVLLFFTYKEGYYSDSNVSDAQSSLKVLNKNIKDFKDKIDSIKTLDLTASESLTSINNLLLTKDNALYVGGVVTAAENIKKELDLYQSNLILLKEKLDTISNIEIVQYTDQTKSTTVKVSLSTLLQNLSDQASELTNKLNKLPDK
jgi:hypothetical protein